MPKAKKTFQLPENYVQLEGSERRPSPNAKLIGPADEAEIFQVTIVLRRRTDGEPLPDFNYFAETPPGKRKRYEMDEFTEKFGAHPDEIGRIVEFAEKSGLKVVETHPARRTVVVSGTVAQMSNAFVVKLERYEHIVERRHGKEVRQHKEIYRGRDGFIHVPQDLANIIMGVFGLDNRNVSHRNSSDPLHTTTVTVQQVAQLYNFPTNSAAGQTIGIVSTSSRYGGYYQSDLLLYFGAALPTVTPISCMPGISDILSNGSIEAITTVQTPVGGTVLTFASTTGILVDSYPYGVTVADPDAPLYVTAVTATTVTLNQAVTVYIPVGAHIFFNPDGETTQDICIAAGAAPGANVAVYFSYGDQNGWVTTINRAAIPDVSAGDPVCSVLSSSWYISGGDDADGLMRYGVTANTLNVISAAFQNAAILGEITICIASGDYGSNSAVGKYLASYPPAVYAGDNKAHVQYPASDPYVLAIGGTTIGNIVNTPLSCDEYVWNDPPPLSDPSWAGIHQWGTTGGGVSDFFGLPAYQNNAGVPKSIYDGVHVGRGVPDVAGNASYNSGYSGLFVAGQPDIGNGTSASAPHWAGLLAVINAALGVHVGFINPYIYKLGSSLFRDINPPADGSYGPTNNSNNGIAGYTAGPGWDACTGWGSPNGVALLTAFQETSDVYIWGGYQSPDIIVTDLSTSLPVPIGGMPGGPWDTLLKPSTPYGFSAHVHNDSDTVINNVVVKFWAIPGGVGTSGTMVGAAQTVSIPPYSYVTVQASAPFISAAAGEHLCAVVSIYNPTAGCIVDATNALLIPDPGIAGSHSCSGWRNTDSMLAGTGSRFSFVLGLGELKFQIDKPVKLQFHPIHVPVNWLQIAKVKEIENVLSFVGATKNLPLYLLPEINKNFHSMHLKTGVAIKTGGTIEEREKGQWHVFPKGREEKISLEVSGEIPKDAKNGDIVLMNVTATYPKTENRAARSIDFLEVIHITDEIKKG